MSRIPTEYDATDNHINGQAAKPVATPKPEKPAFSVHVSATGEIAGMAMQVTGTINLAHLKAFACRLTELGFHGPVKPHVWETTAEGLPMCPRHKVPMRKRGKQGDAWFSHQVKDDNGKVFYCKGYEGGDSPGYHLDMEPEIDT